MALFLLKGGLSHHSRVVDYGSGPCAGYAALRHLWHVLSECTGTELSLEYLAIDRAEAMLEVGQEFCSRIHNCSVGSSSYQLALAGADLANQAELLIVSNVMNDGEGNLECGPFLATLTERIAHLEDIVAIEPATEQPSRQMCSLTGCLPTMVHLGPCPSAGAHCTAWTFRQFTKRVYACERRCLGQWSPGAGTCKYSLAILSSQSAPRDLPCEARVVVGRRSASGTAVTCRFGSKTRMPVAPVAAPWDAVDLDGIVGAYWP